MKFKLIYLLFFLLINNTAYSSYVKGVVADEDGELLPFATIYVENTTYGVITNSVGEYFLELQEGEYTIIYSFISYETVRKKVKLTSKPLIIDVVLHSESTKLGEVEIVSDKRDRGREIMQQVRGKRKIYLNAIENYSCNTYLKNSLEKRQIKYTRNEIEKAEEIIVTDTSLDVNFKNEILNFIESVSITNYSAPNHYKEEYLAYHDFADIKDNSISISSELGYGEYSIVPAEYDLEDPYLLYTEVSSGDFNIYKKTINLEGIVEKPIVSPLSNAGAIYYKPDFVSSFYVEGKKIYKIKLTPLFNGEPLFKGILFVEDKTFVIRSFELSISGPMLLCKDFNLIQDYINIDSNVYVPSRREINYTIKEGKYQIIGNARISHSNYKINTVFPDKYFNSEQRVFNDSVYLRDSLYWLNYRPLTLQDKELEYISHTDSIREVHNSEEYLLQQDSIANKVSLGRLLVAGFFHRNRFKRTEFYIQPIVSQFNFFGVGGYRHRVGGYYDKEFISNNFVLEIDGEIDYGIKNKDVRGDFGLGLMYNPRKFLRTHITVGDYYELINSFASFASSFSRSNYVRKKTINISQRMELTNGLFGELFLDYTNMIPITDMQLEPFWDSIFIGMNEPTDFQQYLKSEIRLQFTYIHKQKYYYKENKKIISGSKYPTLNLIYRKGIPGIFSSEVNFDYIEFGVFDEFKFPLLGNSKWDVQAGTFLNKRNLREMEWKYFRGSDLVFFSNPLRSFQLLGPTLATENEFIRGNVMHHFEGAFLNKIPLLHHLKLSTAAGGGFILVPEDKIAHGEIFVGLERVTKIKEQVFKIGLYACSATNTLDSNDFTPFTLKFGISYYNPITKRWDY